MRNALVLMLSSMFMINFFIQVMVWNNYHYRDMMQRISMQRSFTARGRGEKYRKRPEPAGSRSSLVDNSRGIIDKGPAGEGGYRTRIDVKQKIVELDSAREEKKDQTENPVNNRIILIN